MTITQDRVYQREEAMQRVTNGETQADLARAYNVDPAAISRLVRDEPRARDK